jgi:hypothetical protein
VDKSAIGVSKRCCPVCTRLLGLLFPNDRMDICGTHRTVYPCSLPPWLPQDIVEKMVSIYEDELRTILHDLVQEHHGSRRLSGDSKPASIHSMGSGLGQIETNAAAILWAKAKGVEWAPSRKHTTTNKPGPSPHATPVSASIEVRNFSDAPIDADNLYPSPSDQQTKKETVGPCCSTGPPPFLPPRSG